MRSRESLSPAFASTRKRDMKWNAKTFCLKHDDGIAKSPFTMRPVFILQWQAALGGWMRLQGQDPPGTHPTVDDQEQGDEATGATGGFVEGCGAVEPREA